MDFAYSETQGEIRAAVRKLCDQFGPDYWRECDEAGNVSVRVTHRRTAKQLGFEKVWDDPAFQAAPTYEGEGPVLLPAKAGDAIFFVSDIWHRGTPALGDFGRFFLQCHYARRDIAQRIRMTEEVNHLTPEAVARAETSRARKLAGLHRPGFYDL